jgi:hypothetical protein
MVFRCLDRPCKRCMTDSAAFIGRAGDAPWISAAFIGSAGDARPAAAAQNGGIVACMADFGAEISRAGDAQPISAAFIHLAAGPGSPFAAEKSRASPAAAIFARPSAGHRPRRRFVPGPSTLHRLRPGFPVCSSHRQDLSWQFSRRA